jgi:NAD dependent epimerase/dehydratase family
MTKSALIAGVSGIDGNNLARQLVAEGWEVTGLAQRPGEITGVKPIAGDLLDPASLKAALAGVRPSHVFITTWMRQPTEAENIRVNAGMVRSLLGALAGSGSVECVSLVTGLKHYLGPFEAYGKGSCPRRRSARSRHLTDMTDARLLAWHLLWASTTPAALNQAFNVVNGDVFRWSWMWARLAAYFGVEPLPPPPGGLPLKTQLVDAKPIWAEIAAKHGLGEPDLDVLASVWHTDADPGRPIEVLTDMSKSRRLGFRDYQPTEDSFLDLFAELRQRKVIS